MKLKEFRTVNGCRVTDYTFIRTDDSSDYIDAFTEYKDDVEFNPERYERTIQKFLKYADSEILTMYVFNDVLRVCCVIHN